MYRKYENVIKGETFDFRKHYLNILSKIIRFKKDFDIQGHIEYVNQYKKNPCNTCHYQIDEPLDHKRAKNKIFKLFVNTPNYLIETEFKPLKELEVIGLGKRRYQFDILVVNVPHLFKFINHISDVELDNSKMNINMLKNIETDLIFAVELDGSSHSFKKDRIRDHFFFSTYNIITVRYDVGTLIRQQRTVKEMKARAKYSLYKEYEEVPLFNEITIDDIVKECRNIYCSKYPHL